MVGVSELRRKELRDTRAALPYYGTAARPSWSRDSMYGTRACYGCITTFGVIVEKIQDFMLPTARLLNERGVIREEHSASTTSDC